VPIALVIAWTINFDYQGALPFYIAALNQIVLAVFVWIGTFVTRRQVQNRESRPLSDHTIKTPEGDVVAELPAGLIAKQVQAEGLRSEDILGLQSQNRDATLVIAGALILILPIVTSNHLSDILIFWLTISISAVALIVAGLILYKASFYDKARIAIFDTTTMVLVVASLVLGTIVGWQPPPTCDKSNTPGGQIIFQSQA
jgi:hypothetical protein